MSFFERRYFVVGLALYVLTACGSQDGSSGKSKSRSPGSDENTADSQQDDAKGEDAADSSVAPKASPVPKNNNRASIVELTVSGSLTGTVDGKSFSMKSGYAGLAKKSLSFLIYPTDLN